LLCSTLRIETLSQKAEESSFYGLHFGLSQNFLDAEKLTSFPLCPLNRLYGSSMARHS
jgi:hypothetical protein